MKFAYLLVLFFAAVTNARENPFFPADTATKLQYTTNEIDRKPPFDSLTIKLPNTVRVLQSITLKCKNIDGSVTSKEITIDKSVDWHIPLVLTTKKNTKTRSKERKSGTFKTIFSFEFITIQADESSKELFIMTKDKLIRDFLLIHPDKIVLDFKREADFRTFSKKRTGIFKLIRIGNHDGYYRIVITLDGRYRYTIKKKKNGYLIRLR